MNRRNFLDVFRIAARFAVFFGLAAAAPLAAAEFTFFSCSDTHYEETAEQNANRVAGVALMNELPGTAYPQELGGGTVDKPLGVLVLGDLIDDGAVPARSEKQFEFWLRDFGVNGEGTLHLPVYEGFGNHDLSPNRFVQQAIIERNKRRSGLTAVCEKGLHYSWDWHGIHFVQLNLYPGDAWQKESRYGPAHDPEGALKFLVEDLRTSVGDSGRPVILAHHYDPRDDWWLDQEKSAYYTAIKNYNILCIIHGHTGTGIYQWNGIDVVNDGSLPWGGVFVFRITNDDRLYVGQYTPQKKWRLTFSRRIKWKAPARENKFPPEQQEQLAGPEDEVSILVVSDTHYRMDSLAANHNAVQAMNRIAGTPLPESVGGGIVWTPRGVIHAGDTTNDAKPWQWQAFAADYGVDREGALRYPVYETYGNHDGGLGSPVGDGIVERNRRRPGLCAISDNGLHYHWQWDGVHFLNLGVRPGGDERPYNPHQSLAFLRAELSNRVGDSGAPVILVHHFGFDAAHSLNWWTDREREQYYDLIRNYNVVAIFHGHNHECEFYKWRGIDVFNAPHMQWEPASIGFLVAHVTPQLLRVAERKADGTWGRTFRKRIYRSYQEGRVAVVVNNGAGPTDSGPVSAILRAEVVYLDPTAKPGPMRVCWGEQDGGDVADKWTHSAEMQKTETGKYLLTATGLKPDAEYYYRAAMSTSDGDDWADFSWNFRTPPAAVVSNGTPQDVQMDEAVVTGSLDRAAAPTHLLLYWGRTNGAANAQAWENVAQLGPTDIGAFRTVVKNLAPDTAYYYRAKAVNVHGSAWAGQSSSFTTLPAVTVTNGAGAADIRQQSAVLQGDLIMANVRPTRATIYWGKTDGGTNRGAWQHVLELDSCDVGPLRGPIEDLQPATAYYYRTYAENSSGTAWATTSERFVTARDFSQWRRRARIRFCGYDGKAATPQPIRAAARPGIDAESQRTVGRHGKTILKDFPALVVLDEKIPGFRYADFAARDGSDLRLSDIYGSELAYEIETWDAAGQSFVWVKVPLLKGPDTTIFAYWGNPDEVGPGGGNPAGSVWSAGFAGVWHMNEVDARDAMGRNHGKGSGNGLTPGIVSTAQQFPAEGNSVIEIRGVTSDLMIDGPLSISAWVKPLSRQSYLGIVTKGDGWGEFNLHLKAGSGRPTLELKPFLPDAAKAPIGRTELEIGTWHHVAATWDGAQARVFVNGQEDACVDGKGLIHSQSNLLRLGTIEMRHAPCAIDEVRISNTPRPADWYRASWKNQARPAEFYKITVGD
jgi:cytolysin (calcineurin-like family phosphatase)